MHRTILDSSFKWGISHSAGWMFHPLWRMFSMGFQFAGSGQEAARSSFFFVFVFVFFNYKKHMKALKQTWQIRKMILIATCTDRLHYKEKRQNG